MANLGSDLVHEKGPDTVLLEADGMPVGLEPFNESGFLRI
jgi:hypothetical protein